MNKDKYDYDILLSFAGEDREIAESIAEQLEEKGVEVFYDKYNEADLWGKDLYEHLSKVYSEDGRYCIMLISEHYAKKAWTQHERKNAQERAFKENKEYILPVRLDDTKIPGIRDTIGYLDFGEKGVDGIVSSTLKKLDKKGSEKKKENHETKNSPRMPTMSDKFTDKDKEDFLYSSFDYIIEYIQDGLRKLEERESRLETTFRKINEVKILGRIYKDGNEKRAFKIWIGSQLSTESICFRVGSVSIGQDNSINEMISVEEQNNSLQLKVSFGRIGYDVKEEISTQEDAASYLWERIISPLEI